MSTPTTTQAATAAEALAQIRAAAATCATLGVELPAVLAEAGTGWLNSLSRPTAPLTHHRPWWEAARLPANPSVLQIAALAAAESWAHLLRAADEPNNRDRRIMADQFGHAFRREPRCWTRAQIDHALDTGSAGEHLAALLREAGIDPDSIAPAGSTR